MARHEKAGPRSTSIFDQLAQSREDRARMRHAASPLDLKMEMHRLEEAALQRMREQHDLHLQVHQLWKRITRPDTVEFVMRRPPQPWRPASRVVSATTPNATSSGPIEHSTSALDAAMEAATRLRPRLTPSGMDPLAEWSKMRTSETTPPTPPTSTDSPDESR